MAASLSIVPASGSIIATKSACRVTVAGAEDTDSTTYNASNVPAEQQIRYRVIALKTGVDNLVSHEFAVSPTGLHVWDNVIFPAAGAWTVRLVDQRNSSIAATLSVTVS